MPYGSEVRQFGHSGMISELIDDGWHVICAAHIADDDLANQLDSRVELIPLIHEPLPKNFIRLQKLLDLIHQISEGKKQKTKWTYAPEKNKSIKSRISSRFFVLIAWIVSNFPAVYKKLLQIEQKMETRVMPTKWLTLLKELSVDALILNLPRSEILHPALIAARQIGVSRFLFYHTIKDISANGRIIHQFTGIGVWNSWMQKDLIRQNNLILDPRTVYVTGCAHFDCVGRDDLLVNEEIFRQTIGANSNSRLIFFPASTPWVVPDEGRYVRLIINAIEEGILPGDIQIVLRTNPMDTSDYYEKNFSNCPLVLIQRANWRMEKKRTWNFQRRADIILYNSLLHYSSVCVGIPSTVTIECAISHLPVVNFGFDLPGPLPLPGSMVAFWNADFYQQEVRHGVATLGENENDLFRKINFALVAGKQEKEGYDRLISDMVGVTPPLSTKKYLELINQYFP